MNICSRPRFWIPDGKCYWQMLLCEIHFLLLQPDLVDKLQRFVLFSVLGFSSLISWVNHLMGWEKTLLKFKLVFAVPAFLICLSIRLLFRGGSLRKHPWCLQWIMLVEGSGSKHSLTVQIFSIWFPALPQGSCKTWGNLSPPCLSFLIYNTN